MVSKKILSTRNKDVSFFKPLTKSMTNSYKINKSFLMKNFFNILTIEKKKKILLFLIFETKTVANSTKIIKTTFTLLSLCVFYSLRYLILFYFK